MTTKNALLVSIPRTDNLRDQDRQLFTEALNQMNEYGYFSNVAQRNGMVDIQIDFKREQVIFSAYTTHKSTVKAIASIFEKSVDVAMAMARGGSYQICDISTSLPVNDKVYLSYGSAAQAFRDYPDTDEEIALLLTSVNYRREELSQLIMCRIKGYIYEPSYSSRKEMINAAIEHIKS
jgi:hypothetical protein